MARNAKPTGKPKTSAGASRSASSLVLVLGCAVIVAVFACFMHGAVLLSTSSAPLLSPQQLNSDTTEPQLGDDLVVVHSSNIAGAGLGAFAVQSFATGELVGRYRCTVVDDATKSTGVYSWFLNSTHSCDGEAHRLRNPMRYVNSVASHASCGMQNVDVHPDAQTATVTYVASRDIDAGEEIIVDYGEAYFKSSSELVAAGILYECDASAMHLASGRGDLDGVRGLLSGTASSGELVELVNQRSELELARTPLMEAALGGHEHVARLLIQEGADVASVDRRGNSALHVASLHGRHDVVRLLVRNGADADQIRPEGGTPLVIASREGHSDVVTALAGLGADVNLADTDGATPLIAASFKGHVAVVNALAAAGADPNLADADGATPLIIASQEGHLDVVIALADLGADLNLADADGTTPLSKACYTGHLRVATVLSSRGADVNQATAGGATPLIIASQQGHLEMVNALAGLGADANAADAGGATPLIVASQEGHLDVVTALVGIGASANLADAEGGTPLFKASYKGHLDVVTTLIARHGADVNQATAEGATPLIIASQKGHFDVVDALIALGANVNQAAHNGATPLVVACLSGHSDTARVLLSKGADPTANFRGEPLLSIAIRRRGNDVVTQLIRTALEEHT